MNRIITSLLTAALLAASPTTLAQKLYKWVDKDGKVHYSQNPPTETTKSESKLNIPKQDAPAATEEDYVFEDGRDLEGNCRTMKCLADQMEQDRLRRERGYSEQRGESEYLQRKFSRERAEKERAAEPKSRIWPR